VFDGRVPYRDFFMEYPPGALAVFLPADVFGAAHYNAAFKSLMALCGVATLFTIALLLVRLGASEPRIWVASFLFALSPIALGPISLNTYDAWPALLTVVALALLLAGNGVAALALLGLAFAAKVYPVVLLPVALAFVWRTGGRRLMLRSLGAFAGAAAILVAPFLVLAPHGLAESFRAQAGRGLQEESLFGSALAVADRIGVYGATIVHRAGRAISYDLAGSLPDALAVLSSVLQGLAVLAVVWLYLRGRDDPRRLTAAFAAAVIGFLAFTRFFSPQYLVWVVPFAVLLGPAVWVLVGLSLVLAQLWFFHYHHGALGGYFWLVLLRDLLLAVLYGVVVARLRVRLPVKDQNPVLLEDQAPLRITS
jgi:uncharacterized membrane protein